MINIKFEKKLNSGSYFTVERNAKGYLKTATDHTIPVSSEWNGKPVIIQTIIYDAFEFNIYLRDTDYQEFQKIQYTDNIVISEQRSFSAGLVSFSSEPLGNEFWNVKLTVYDKSSKKIENSIFRGTNYGNFIIWNGETNLYTAPIYNEPFDDLDFERTLADDFNENVKDFSKTSEYYQVRLYFTSSDLYSFIGYLEQINNFNVYTILYNGSQYKDFDIKKNKVAYDLFEIDLKLYSDRRINT